VHEFRASLMDPHKSILLLPCQLQNPVNPSHLVKNWRTIKQLKNLNPHELQQGTTFLCRATLKGIDCTKGWFYQSCFHCKSSISGDGINSFCIQGCPDNPPPVPQYEPGNPWSPLPHGCSIQSFMQITLLYTYVFASKNY